MGLADNWTRENIAWAAGLFEGEGCIVFRSPRNPWRLSLSSTDEDVIRKYALIVGVGGVYGPQILKNPKWKPIWTWWCTTAEKASALLVAFHPFLGKRRRAKAEDFLRAFAEARPRSKCPKGHFYTPENTYFLKGRWKYCRECALARSRIRYEKKRTNNVPRHIRESQDGGSQHSSQE